MVERNASSDAAESTEIYGRKMAVAYFVSGLPPVGVKWFRERGKTNFVFSPIGILDEGDYFVGDYIGPESEEDILPKQRIQFEEGSENTFYYMQDFPYTVEATPEEIQRIREGATLDALCK